MYSVYGVVIDTNKTKHRYFLNLVESFDEAKHIANCATCGNAAYAYVKDIDNSTVFFIKSIDPVINEIAKARAQGRQYLVSQEDADRLLRRYNPQPIVPGQMLRFPHREPANS